MTNPDPRPHVWVGHIEMHTNQLRATEDFMTKIGMRPVFAEGLDTGTSWWHAYRTGRE